MSFYDVNGKFAIVTGAGSGINHCLAKLLLEAGCSVAIADLNLRPEAEATYRKYPYPAKDGTPSALFHKTDLTQWSQITSLWESVLKAFGRIDIVVNGAGIYEPPSSSFWFPPGISPAAQDSEHGSVYRTLAVNTVAPIRLAQIAVDYWLQNRDVSGNLLWIASVGGYTHSLQSPLYFASKAAIVSMTTSLAQLRSSLGIRNACVCPGVVDTPIFHPDYCKDQMRAGDVLLSPTQCAKTILEVLQEPQYGDGNIVEVMANGTYEEPSVHVREVPMQALYPTACSIGHNNHLFEEGQKFLELVQEKGMRL